MSLSSIRAQQGETQRAGGVSQGVSQQTAAIGQDNQGVANTADTDSKGRADNKEESMKADFDSAKRDAARDVKFAELQNGVSMTTQVANAALGLVNKLFG